MKKITEKKLPIVAKLVSECLEGKILRFQTDYFLTHEIYSGRPEHGDKYNSNRIYIYDQQFLTKGKSMVKYLGNMKDVFNFTRLKSHNFSSLYATLNLKNLLNNYSNGAEAFELALQIKTEKS